MKTNTKFIYWRAIESGASLIIKSQPILVLQAMVERVLFQSI